MENKMMVMRSALRDVSHVVEEMTRGTMTGESVDRKTVDAWAKRLCEIISRDIAIPLSNCEVGTVEEQMKKFRQFCESHKPAESEFTETGELLCPASGCELGVCNYGQCALKWAQMPYEADEGDAE